MVVSYGNIFSRVVTFTEPHAIRVVRSIDVHVLTYVGPLYVTLSSSPTLCLLSIIPSACLSLPISSLPQVSLSLSLSLSLSHISVSYTHLDVYKRQYLHNVLFYRKITFPFILCARTRACVFKFIF